MIYPLLPAFVTGVLGAGAGALGALDGAADFAATFVKYGAGRRRPALPFPPPSRPAPPFPPPSPRHRGFLPPPHARNTDHPARAAARGAGDGRPAAVGGPARGAVVVELRRRRAERPHRPAAHDVDRLAVLRAGRRRLRARGFVARRVAPIPRLRTRRGPHRESRAGAGLAARRHASAVRV